jgi:multimeric flavodoxin WrbA
MKVLGIYGSPRPGGNSDLLLDTALGSAAEAGAEVTRLYARDLKMAGCRECGGCDQSGICVWDDEMQSVYPRLEAAEAIVLSTPIFFYAMPSQLKALLDRGQALWNRRRLRKTGEELQRHDRGRGYLIAVGATRGRNLFEGVELTARYFFDALDKSYEGGIFFRQAEGKSSIAERPEALREARGLGCRAAVGK